MVDRRALEFDCELDTGARPELVAVQAPFESCAATCVQHRAALLGVERAALAEGVDPARMRRARVEHRAAHQRDVVVGAAVELRRHDVSAEECRLVGQLLADAQQPGFVVWCEAVTGLDLDRRDAGGARLGPTLLGERAQQFVVGGAGGVDRRAHSPCFVRTTGHPGGEFVGSITGEHEVRVAVDEARDDAASGGVDAFVGRRCRARTDIDDAVAVEHDVRVADDTGTSGFPDGVIGDEHADPLDDGGGHGDAHRPFEFGGDVDAGVGSVAHDHGAADDHVRDVRRAGGEDDAVEGVGRTGAGGAHRVEPDRAEIGEGADLDAPGVGPAERGVAVGGGGLQQRVAAMAAALAGGESLVEFDRPRFLEQVDERVGVGSEREARAGVAQRPGRCDAVGEVALGRRAHAYGAAVRPEQAPVAVAHMHGVHRRESVTQNTEVGQQRGWCAAVRGEALFVLGGLLGDVAVERHAPLASPCGDGGDGVGIDRPHGVDRGAQPHGGTGEPVAPGGPLRPGERVAVAETALGVVRLEADATGQVAGVEQRDPHARLAGRGDHGLAHGVGVAVRRSARAVVDVVELADGGDPGEGHLGERRRSRAGDSGRV